MRKSKEPEFCPKCGHGNITTTYQNDIGPYQEWYEFECEDCRANGTVAIRP